MDVALAARAGFEVVFEIRILSCGAAEFFDGGFGERSAAEIGVEDDAGGVDDRLKRLREDLLDGVGDFILQGGRIEREDDRAAAVSVGFFGGGSFGGEACTKSASAARVTSRAVPLDAPGERSQAGCRSSSSTDGICRQQVGFGCGGHGDISAQLMRLRNLARQGEFSESARSCRGAALLRPACPGPKHGLAPLDRAGRKNSPFELAVGTGLWQRKYGADMGEIRRGYR